MQLPALTAPVVGRDEIEHALRELGEGAPRVPRPLPLLFRLRPGVDLRTVTFDAYPLDPGEPNLQRIVLVPFLPRPQATGTLGIEIVSPDHQILRQVKVALGEVISNRPVSFEFPPIADSGRRGFELRVFAREAPEPIHVFEYRPLLTVLPRRVLAPRVLCSLGFAVDVAPPAPTPMPDVACARPDDGESRPLFAVDSPLGSDVEIANGVFSIRGWAYSPRHGPGRLVLELSSLPSAGPFRRIPVGHRYCRFDVPHVIPSIPAVNYAGFEVSVDRFDLPPQAEARLMFESPDGRHRLAAFQVRASHAEPVEAPDVIRCDCCGRDENNPLGKKDGLTIVQCGECGLAFTSPRPDFARIGQRYSQRYFIDEYLPSMQADHEAHRARWNYYLDQVERYKALNARLFEVGTGAGYLLKEAVGRGWMVSGIDVNPAAVTYARDSLGLEVSCHNIDAPDLPLAEGAFGAILLESTLEHFLSPRRVIAACARALQPGGGLFIWTLAIDGDVVVREGMAMKYVGPSEHLFYFSATALCRLCEDNGLRVERMWRDDTGDGIAVVASKRLDRVER